MQSQLLTSQAISKHFLGSVVFILGLGFFAYGKTISIRGDSWCPYNCDPGSVSPGFMIEIAKAVFEKVGHTVDYQSINWERAKKEGREGKIDAIVGAYKEDAPDFIFPEEAQGFSTNRIFVKSGEKWRYSGPESIKGKKIGVITGYSYDDMTDKWIKEKHPSFSLISGDKALVRIIKMVDVGRLIGFYEDPNVVAATLKTLNRPRNTFEIAGYFSLKNSPVFIAFSPSLSTSKEFAKILSHGTAELRKSGQLASILKKYEVIDWKAKQQP